MEGGDGGWWWCWGGGDAKSESSNCPKYGAQTVDVLCKRRPAAGGAGNSGNSQIPSTDSNFQRLEI